MTDAVLNQSPLPRKGIVLAGGSGSRLFPLTVATSKQLMPVYDKPMIYYPISVLMLAGIRDMMVVSTPQDLPNFQRLLGDGSQFGVGITYAEQPRPEGLPQAYLIAQDFLKNAPSALVLGDNLFYGAELGRILQEASSSSDGGTIFGCEVSNPQDYGVIEFDKMGNPVSLEEKPAHPKSRWAVPGLYFFDSEAPQIAGSLKPSRRGELEITDLIRHYMERARLKVCRFGRGTAWLDTGTHESLLEAGHFVQTIQNRQGLRIACLEEIGLHKGWLSREQVAASTKAMGRSSYARYLADLSEREEL